MDSYLIIAVIQLQKQNFKKIDIGNLQLNNCKTWIKETLKNNKKRDKIISNKEKTIRKEIK